MIDRSTLRIALRTLSRHRGFTTVAILSLAIAIALNTTMYSALDAMLRPDVAVRRPEHIYSITYYGDRQRTVSPDDIEKALSGGPPTYEGVTGVRIHRTHWRGETLLEGGGRYTRAFVNVVRANFFDFLGARAREGRTFLARDEAEATAVVSDRTARKLFPDESPVGRPLLIDGNGYTIIGVVERSATFFPLSADAWILRPSNSEPVWLNLIRFREKIDPNTIGDALKGPAAQLALAAGLAPGSTAFRGKALENRHQTLTSFHRALIGAVIAVLLVACANLANLQLARGLGRSRELALRSAVGASRRQLIGTLLVESGILAAVGLLLGLILTLWGIHLMKASMPPQVEDYVIAPQTSWRMFAFASSAAVVCLVIVGLLPAWHVSKVDPDTLLKSSAGTGANRHHRRRYGAMVIAQIGCSLPVLIGAIVALMGALRAHDRRYLTHEMYGYDPAPLVVANVPVAIAPEATVMRIADVAAELTARAKSVRGVIDAAAVQSYAPVKYKVTVDEAGVLVREMPAALWAYSAVSPSYLRVFGRAMARGRDFAEGEFDGTAVIMDAGSAKYLWGEDNPIGKIIKFGDAQSNLPWHRVVGIVGDLRDTFALRRRDYTVGFRLGRVYRVITPRDSTVLVDSRARRVPAWALEMMRQSRATITIYARVQGNTELAALRLQRELRTAKSSRGPTVLPMEEELGVSERRIRNDFVASMFSTFAVIGLALVAIGVYGIVSHSIAERRRELAVRISLGASARDILHSVLREGNVLILAGIAIGLLLTKYSVWWLETFWATENSGYDAPLFALIAALLFALAAAAAFVPAWRATRIDPVEALRSE